MRNFLLILAIAAVTFAASCTNTPEPPPRAAEIAPPKPAATKAAHDDPGHDAPRISLTEAKKDFDAGTAVFVDTHQKEQFAIQHIRGAINIPGNDIGTKADKIPKGKKIIAYCS